MGAPYTDVMQHYFTDTANIVKYLPLKAESFAHAEEVRVARSKVCMLKF
jgi:hypothetical protein